MEPLIIVGAPRSGTNALRNAICSLPQFTTWPCDEINYIWRHGNASFPTDCLDAELATPDIRKYIVRKASMLLSQHQKSSPDIRWLVEKTCANCLRLDFVSRIFPNAKILYIARSPYDVVLSAKKRWCSSIDIAYLLKKVRYAPFGDIPRYSFSLISSRLKSSFSGERRLATWGPRFPGIDDIASSQSLDYLCAYQWRYCTLSAERFLSGSSLLSCSIAYEDFVASPFIVLKNALDSLGFQVDEALLASASSEIHSKSLNLSASAFTCNQLKDIGAAFHDVETLFSLSNP